MEKQSHLLFLALLFSSSAIISTEVLACEGRHGHPHHHHHHRHHHCHGSVKLFVFGDSYADTGNSAQNSSHAWNQPYGITFPGKPAGRFSDGRVLTDYIASFLGIRSPLPFRWKKYVRRDKLESGMNFAYGGSGVFETWLTTVPNMTTQIDYFQQLIKEKLYTKNDLDSSIALVSLAGNDYITYVLSNGSLEYMPDFSKSIVKQLVINLKRIHSLGVRKVVVVGLEPVGCLPAEYIASDDTCSKIWNDFSKNHNSILKRAVKKLNNESCPDKSVFKILDLYKAFMSAFKQKHHGGCSKFKNPFESCCVGLNGYSCGDVDEKGVKQYSVCEDPESSFFWDLLHPTQSGWHAVYSALKPSLYPLL